MFSVLLFIALVPMRMLTKTSYRYPDYKRGGDRYDGYNRGPYPHGYHRDHRDRDRDRRPDKRRYVLFLCSFPGQILS